MKKYYITSVPIPAVIEGYHWASEHIEKYKRITYYSPHPEYDFNRIAKAQNIAILLVPKDWAYADVKTAVHSGVIDTVGANLREIDIEKEHPELLI